MYVQIFNIVDAVCFYSNVLQNRIVDELKLFFEIILLRGINFSTLYHQRDIKNCTSHLPQNTILSIVKANKWMLFMELNLVCCENHAKPVHTLYEQNTEILNVKLRDVRNTHYAFKCQV